MKHTGQTGDYSGLPYITNNGEERLIADINNDTLVGYKYFLFEGEKTLTLTARMEGDGYFEIYTGDEKQGDIAYSDCKEWTEKSLEIKALGQKALYFKFKGSGTAQLLEFRFS